MLAMQTTSLRWRGPIQNVLTERMRPAIPQDQALIDELFYQDRAAQFAAAGLAEAQIQSLVQMQARGRQMTYAAQYPAAEDWILLDDHGEPVGRLLLDRQPDCWRIVDFAVLASHRGQGLGTQALREYQRQAAAAGAALKLQVMRFNPARRLYERLGFQAATQDAVAVEMVWSAIGRA